MTKTKSTKRALLLSALSLLLCVSMLVGSTFAWFTDSVTSGKNKIVAGNLDVELDYYDATAKAWKTVEAEDELFTGELWEPGHTEVVYLRLTNAGSLALKYQLGINIASETGSISVETNKEFKLSDFIKFSVVGNVNGETAPFADRATAVAEALKVVDGNKKINEGYSDSGVMLAKQDPIYMAMVVYMPETVGNEANYKKDAPVPTIELGINLLATQKDVDAEKDSFGKDYDEDAWHPDMKVYNADDLRAAIENAEDGDVIAFFDDIESDDGLVITDKQITLDLNGQTFAVNNGASTNNRNFKINGNSVVTIKNGALIANGTMNAGAYGTIRTEDAAKVTLSNMKLYNYRGNGLNIKALEGTTVTINDTEIYSQYGGGVEAAGGIVELNNVKIEQKGMWTAPYNSMAVSVNGGGKATINSGTYTTACLTAEEANNQGTSHGPWAIGVLNSGGTLVVNGGTFSNDNFGDNSLATAARGLVLADTGAVVEINGGTFNALKNVIDIQNNLGDASKNPSVTLTGGTFSADPTTSAYSYLIKIADGFKAVDNGDGTYTVLPDGMSTVSGYSRLYTDGTNYYVYDAQGLISMRDFWAANWLANNMWGRSYNVMADIDATGYTWNNVWVNVGYNGNEGFVFDGHSKTITGLTINDGLFSGTPNGSDKPDVPGYVKDITFDGVKVTGDHFAGVLWSNVYNDLVVENVNVINSTITGKCNVAALVGGTVIEYPAHDATVKFIGCVVKNNVITAEGKDGQDPNGANVYLSRAYGNTTVTFENCVDEGNTVTNKNGLVGGGIYGYTTWANDGFAGTGTCDSFTDWNGISVVTESTTLSDALNTGASKVLLSAGTYTIPSAVANKTVVLEGTGEDTVIDFTKVNTASNASITFRNMHFKGTNANVMNGFGIQGTTGHIAYENCTFDGAVTNEYYGSVSYKDCTFTGIGYITTYAVKSASFENCVFDKADSRAVLVYSHGDNPCVVTLKDCEFKAAEKAYTWNGDWTSAIEVDTTNIPTLGTSVTIEGCTYDANFSGLYRDKSAAGKANAVITVVAE